MSKKKRQARPAVSIAPLSVVTVVAIIGSLALIAFTIPMINRDGWAGLVWGIPGVVVLVQPFLAWIRGKGNTLKVGLSTYDLTTLRKVLRYQGRTVGVSHQSALLWFGDHSIEVSGLFHRAKSIDDFVSWLRVETEYLDGVWNISRFSAQRQELLPINPQKDAKQGEDSA